MSFKPSSSTEGFFQALPEIPPQYTSPDGLLSSASSKRSALDASDDRVLARILSLYLPSQCPHVNQDVHRMARISLHPDVLALSVDAESNHPVLKPLTTFGEENKTNPLWTTAGWKGLKDIGYREGVVAVAYDTSNTTWNRRIHEFALGHLWSCTATMTGCPMGMTDGAATLLSKHLEDADDDQPRRAEVFKEAYRRLISRDPAVAWTSGQWMTERTGGSDVSGTETVARRLTNQELAQENAAGHDTDATGMPLGPWRIDGFKWFSSATDSEMAVLLAQTPKGGLSAFYIPMRRKIRRPTETLNGNHDDIVRTELNGIRIQRLKNKLGTKSLPTAELELKGTRGWLIGAEGKGVKEISAILNLTRLSTATGSVANWGRGLAVCRAYTKVRKVRGGLLQDNPAHLRWMADETIKYWASAHFAFFGVALQGALEQDWDLMVKGTKAEPLIPNEKIKVQTLLRLLTPVMKARVSVESVSGLRECMECLGGVGYCENNEDGGLLNIAKIFRDNLVNPIWEGTVSVMAEDVVRVLIDKRLAHGDVLGNLFAPWVRTVLGSCSNNFKDEIQTIEDSLQALLALARAADKEELLYHGRELLNYIEVTVCGCLLMFDASVHQDDASTIIATRWIQSKTGKSPRNDAVPWEEQAIVNKMVFLGSQNTKFSKLERL